MTEKKGYTEENAKTIDQWVDDGWIWGMPISHAVSYTHLTLPTILRV